MIREVGETYAVQCVVIAGTTPKEPNPKNPSNCIGAASLGC